MGAAGANGLAPPPSEGRAPNGLAALPAAAEGGAAAANGLAPNTFAGSEAAGADANGLAGVTAAPGFSGLPGASPSFFASAFGASSDAGTGVVSFPRGLASLPTGFDLSSTAAGGTTSVVVVYKGFSSLAAPGGGTAPSGPLVASPPSVTSSPAFFAGTLTAAPALNGLARSAAAAVFFGGERLTELAKGLAMSTAWVAGSLPLGADTSAAGGFLGGGSTAAAAAAAAVACRLAEVGAEGGTKANGLAGPSSAGALSAVGATGENGFSLRAGGKGGGGEAREARNGDSGGISPSHE